MKVCITSDVFPPSIGGIQTFTYGLARHLSRNKRINKVSVVAFGKEGAKENLSEKLDILRLPNVGPLKKGLSMTRQLFKRRNYDIFHSTTILPAGFFTSCFNSFFAHKKFIVTVFGLDALKGFRDEKTRLLTKQVFNRSDKIVFFSNFTKREVKRLYKLEEDKITSIYPGISVPRANQEETKSLMKKYKIRKENFVVLFVGRLVERKGVDDLIRAIGRIKEKGIKLLIVGEGLERKKLVRLIKELGLCEKVILVGGVPHYKIHPFYKLADTFCMPSKYLREKGDVEGLGLVFLEAQSHGIPVIGTDSGGVPEAIEDNKTGFIVPEESPATIADKLLNLINDKELREKMSEYAPKFIEKKFSWERCVDEYIELYRE